MFYYHKIMQYVWLVVSAITLVISTYFGLIEGFGKWWMMYLFVVIAAIQYFRHKIQFKKMTPPTEESSSDK